MHGQFFILCLRGGEGWSGRGESNPRGQFGKLEFYH